MFNYPLINHTIERFAYRNTEIQKKILSRQQVKDVALYVSQKKIQAQTTSFKYN